MTFKLFRRGSARCIGLLSAFVTILLFLYYISIGQPSLPAKDAAIQQQIGGGGGGSTLKSERRNTQQTKVIINGNPEEQALENLKLLDRSGRVESEPLEIFADDGVPTSLAAINEAAFHNPNWGDKCYVLGETPTNITSVVEFARFDFQPEWIRAKEYWDRGFEDRYEEQKTAKNRPMLKVIIVPHSHNDPGWLKTFVNYFQSASRQILNLMVKKMQQYDKMTFIWSEISFLQMWWDQAHPTKQRALKRLIDQGRLEITTGGWVMTDEANAHVYAMVDQLIEGHQWLRANLNVTPSTGWSIDPFGHGGTVPYLLSESNFEGAIIQRIHYAWKQWFARHQKGDFMWTPFWQQRGAPATQRGQMLTHNLPFDIYSIQGSCGPHPYICLNFDFRKIPGEYTEYSAKAQFITDENIEEKAQLLVDQYARTASLLPHNVALIPLGDDFRYNYEREFDQQYTNYKKLIDHINANKQLYNAEISFGTPRDYFKVIRDRTKSFPTFKGDFYVYADIFSEGRPAYWSGYFTTRPFFKLLSGDLEHNLRSAEILFTIAYNTARQLDHKNAIKIFEKNYEKMILARRNLGLFQHHDAITGTSKAAVMRDYGLRLFESITDMVKMQESAIEQLLQSGNTQHHHFLLSELERDNYNKLPRKTVISLGAADSSGGDSVDTNSGTADGVNATKAGIFVIYNSLAQKRLELVTLRSPLPNVKVMNERDEQIHNVQINPVWNITDINEMGLNMGSTGTHIRVSSRQYEVIFLAELEALSLTTFRLVVVEDNYKKNLATIYCEDCTDAPLTTTGSAAATGAFLVKSKPPGDIQLENNHMRLLFDEKSGFLKTVTRKNKDQKLLKPMQCAIKFASYRSAQFHSGAYLFKTDSEQGETEKDVLEQYDEVRIIITTGPIASDVSVIYGPFLAHTVRIFNTHTHLDAAIYIENDINFEPPPKNRETELFMRFITDIDNITPGQVDILKEDEPVAELPVFYTDQNGFQYQRRIKVPTIGIEGNYYPITTSAFMQDAQVRFTLITTHAQGAASYEPGQLEVMLDRRTLYDDYRGMGEGVVDNCLTRHKFWVLIEDMPTKVENDYQVPSLRATQFANGLRYPTNLYFIEATDAVASQLNTKVQLLSHGALPCDVHLLNLRTLSEEQLQIFPSPSALLVLQRQGHDCSVGHNIDISGICPQTEQQNGLGRVQFNQLLLERLETTSLTGMQRDHERTTLHSFSDIMLSPMELRTFNVTFRG